ncbi:MAG TPA: helix-hairpin-helix domain-containing protein [Bryobacteraceae bacterium]|nr:helix-hairpin-helix domain-containing protein [Bryobacteraceae bacterium]
MKRILVWTLMAGSGFAAADEQDAMRLPEGAGKETVARLCLDCHDTGNFRKRRLSRDEWSDKVADMADRGAKGTEAELDAVVEYLVRYFGPDAKINVNTAPMVELKTILGITAQQAQAVADYREANGRFERWQDLQKVPGVDGKKIEEKKDLMAF